MGPPRERPERTENTKYTIYNSYTKRYSAREMKNRGIQTYTNTKRIYNVREKRISNRYCNSKSTKKIGKSINSYVKVS
jgi:hypothetical protein